MIVLMGESGSGKSTVEKELIAAGYTKAISLTTRTPRDGEVDGEDYIFVTKEELDKLDKTNQLGERVPYLDNYYALHKDQIQDDRVVVVVPEGLKQLKEKPDLDIFAVYLYASEETRLDRMLGRGDSLTYASERVHTDRTEFLGVRELSDLVMNTEGKSVKTISQEILKLYTNR